LRYRVYDRLWLFVKDLKKLSQVVIKGPAGNLEGFFEDQGSATGAVLCHPHPQFGGSMHDMVLSAVNDGLVAAGISTLRFNFRGVGASEGEHDQGRGEVQDVLAAIAWLAERCESVILAGYSFGAVMAFASEPSACEKLILVAPPVSMLRKLEPLSPSDVPTLVVAGEADQFVDAGELSEWFSGQHARVVTYPDADHSFFGRHQALTDEVHAFVSGVN
jgi:alpha/beta superfamily hydrolase